jgi:hypothetical protein
MTTRGAHVRALAIAFLGACVLGVLAERIGAATIVAASRPMLSYVAPLVIIEGARLCVETWGARALYDRRPRLARLARAQLVGYAACYLLPVGRAVGEALKARILGREVGPARAAAVAWTIQVATLAAVGATTLIGAFGALMLGARGIAAALTLLGVATSAAAVLVHAAVVRPAPPWLARLLPRTVALATSMRSARPRASWPAHVAMAASRALQIVEVGALVCVSPHGALLVRAVAGGGMHLLGASLGDVVPAQLGATDLALASGAPGLGVDAATAVAVAGVMRIAQLSWVVVGLLCATMEIRKAKRSAIDLDEQ